MTAQTKELTTPVRRAPSWEPSRTVGSILHWKGSSWVAAVSVTPLSHNGNNHRTQLVVASLRQGQYRSLQDVATTCLLVPLVFGKLPTRWRAHLRTQQNSLILVAHLDAGSATDFQRLWTVAHS